MKRKNTIKVLGVLMIAFLFSGCITKSDYTLSSPEELARYEYAVIGTLSESTPALPDLEAGLKDTLAEAGLTVLDGDDQAVLDSAKPGQVLLAEYAMEEGSLETRIDVFYSDYVSAEEVACCRGTWGLKSREKKAALSEDNAVKQTRYLFGLADEMEEYNKYSWY